MKCGDISSFLSRTPLNFSSCFLGCPTDGYQAFPLAQRREFKMASDRVRGKAMAQLDEPSGVPDIKSDNIFCRPNLIAVWLSVTRMNSSGFGGYVNTVSFAMGHAKFWQVRNTVRGGLVRNRCWSVQADLTCSPPRPADI